MKAAMRNRWRAWKELVAAGVFKPVIDRRYRLDQLVVRCATSTMATPAGKVLVIPELSSPR